jgi:hypothetical protein
MASIAASIAAKTKILHMLEGGGPRAWRKRHQRFTFHFTPTSRSRANAVEGRFAKLTRQRLKRGVFTSIVALQAAVNRFIADANGKPKPLVWTKSADAILTAVDRGRQGLEALQ